MKYTMMIFLLLNFINSSCSYLHQTQSTQRIPANEELGSSSEASKKACGLSGSIETRIRDCASENKVKSNIVLVMRTEMSIFEVYKDLESGFIWLQDNIVGDISFSEAKDYCKKLKTNLNDYLNEDWRLPTRNNYQNLVSHIKGPELSSMKYFWSSSKGTEGYVYSVIIYNGEFNTSFIDHESTIGASVRCIAK